MRRRRLPACCCWRARLAGGRARPLAGPLGDGADAGQARRSAGGGRGCRFGHGHCRGPPGPAHWACRCGRRAPRGPGATCRPGGQRGRWGVAVSPAAAPAPGGRRARHPAGGARPESCSATDRGAVDLPRGLSLAKHFLCDSQGRLDLWPELAPRGYDGLAWAGRGGVWAGEGFVVRGSGWTGVVPQATGWGRRFPARPGEPPRGRVCSRQTQICQEMHENLVITSPEIFYNLVAELFLRMTANATRPTAFPKRERTHLSRIHTLRPPPCPAPHPVPSGSR